MTPTKTIAALATLALVVTVGVVVFLARDRITPLLEQEQCTATVDGHEVTLELDQARNAGLIAGIAVRRGLPARAVSIALATAYQESKIRNLDHGDRDSLGIFQQRPSQGWGTPEQLQDPAYATNAFYDALEEVEGYRDMEITVAAQEVQRSGFPDAYADHEEDARALASALTGHSAGTFSCTVDAEVEEAPDRLNSVGLTARADRVRRDLLSVFGDLPMGGFAPRGVSTGHQEGSTHYSGRAVDVFFRPVNDANRTRGWAVAQYLVSQADRLDVQTVIFDDRIWTARRSSQGWRDYDAPQRAGSRAILEHRDHVHVDVFD